MFSPVHPLPHRLRWLFRSLRTFIDADWSEVQFTFVPGLGVDGLAFGTRIALSADLLSRPPADLLHAATHELVHVFQQRNGRVQPTHHVGSVPVNLDPELESEAEAAAIRVSHGERIHLSTTGTSSPRAPVLQALITVGGLHRSSEGEFSAAFTRLLGLIPEGPTWLAWALRTPGPALSFADDFSLLTGIQLGLHGTGDVCFQSAGLRLSPSILLDLTDPDFGNIVGSLETGQLTAAARSSLARLGIRTESDFSTLSVKLDDLGVSAALPLVSPPLAEQVNLTTQFVDQTPPDDAPVQAAAQFAAANAQTPTDFGAAFAFYLAAQAKVEEPDPTDNFPAQLWTALSGLAFPYLQCPNLDPLTPDALIPEFIAAYLRRASFIGFPSLAVALAAIASQPGLDLSLPLADGTADKIQTWLVSLAQVALPQADGGPMQPKITHLQDGLTRWIDYQGKFGSARLQLDPSGLLTLRRFTPAK